MNYNSSLITKYLNTYAEPDIQALDLFSLQAFDSVLVIPVYDEPLDQLLNIVEQVQQQSTLLIYVFNAPDVERLDKAIYHDNKEAQERTVSALQDLLKETKAEIEDGYYQAQIGSNSSLVILDYCREGNKLPAKQGVGLARKLGVDLALKAVAQQFLKTGKELNWLHSSDADVFFPKGYFDISPPAKNTSAAVYAFQHEAEPGFATALALYEHSLRYYVEQLSKAGSPYAFHTIGSLIAVCPTAYAMVRGFPKRSAGEDFYLLNKLAKVGKVASLARPIVTLAGRPSHRVPFGTGPALKKINSLGNPEATYTFYHPSCFKVLKVLLDIISYSGQSFASTELLFDEIRDKMSLEESDAVIQALLTLNIDKQFKHLSQKREHSAFVEGFHIWFDAFVTLRFIHELRDSIYPNVLLEALPELDAPVINGV